MEKTWEELEREDLAGKVFVIPTDTIYGFSCMSFDKKALKKLYIIKKMPEEKPIINLISDIEQMEKFSIELTKKQKIFLKKNWPAKLTVILKNKYKEKLSFRIPEKESLRKFLKKVGPVVSTSFNISGKKYFTNTKEIQIFPKVDFYIDEGEVDSKESMIIEILR